MSEENLVLHASATLAGIKTANMFTDVCVSKEETIRQIRRLNVMLCKKGLRVLPLRYEKNRVLLYLYRPKRLSEDLKDQKACHILEELGYPCTNSERCIIRLIEKLKLEKEFPHEIGLFLGYPPEDVEGFMQNQARNSKCVGYWKVYGDVKKAKENFARYQNCSAAYQKKWQEGVQLEELAVAAY